MTEGVRDEVGFTGDGWRMASLWAAPGRHSVEPARARLSGEVGETKELIEPGRSQ